MNKNRLILVIFIAIIVLGGFLRLYQLDSIPPHPFLDEVSNGYNAYSLLKTGNDEFGAHLPILLRAYDDWRSSIFVYFSIPFVWAFGLNIFSVRLASVVLSIGAIIFMYLLTKEIVYIMLEEYFIQAKKKYKATNIPSYIALCTAFCLAISPWHIYNSRFSNEPNLGITMLIAGTYFFVSYINVYKKSNFGWRMILACMCFAVSLISYGATKIFIPLFVISIAALYIQEILNHKKAVVVGILLGIGIVLPSLIASLDPNATIRFQAVNIISQNRDLLTQSAMRLDADREEHNFVGYFFDNRRLTFVYPVLMNYFSNFSFVWLFVGRDTPSWHLPFQGVFYIFALPLILLGIYGLIYYHLLNKRIGLLLLLWLIIAPIPSAITIESPHANRAYQLLPILVIFQGIGLWYVLFIIQSLKSMFLKRALAIMIGFLIVLSIFRFYHNYFYLLRREKSEQFEYGVLQALSYAKQNESEYDHIVVSNRDRLLVSYMYYLFSSAYDPKKYQDSGGTKIGNLDSEHAIGKYMFVDPQKHEVLKNTLYLINPDEIHSPKLRDIKHIQYLDDKDAVWIESTR